MKIPILSLFLRATDVDERLGKEVVEKVDIGMGRALQNIQSLEGQEIVLEHRIRIKKILSRPEEHE